MKTSIEISEMIVKDLSDKLTYEPYQKIENSIDNPEINEYLYYSLTVSYDYHFDDLTVNLKNIVYTDRDEKVIKEFNLVALEKLIENKLN